MAGILWTPVSILDPSPFLADESQLDRDFGRDKSRSTHPVLTALCGMSG